MSKIISFKAPAPGWIKDAASLRALLSGAWKNVSSDWIERVRSAFNAEDADAVGKLLETADTLGLEMSEAIGSKSEAILSNLQTKAHSYWIRQATRMGIEDLIDYGSDYQGFLVQTHADAVKRFAETYPTRILHPEITRQLDYLRESELTRTVDLTRINERLDLTMAGEKRYWQGMSDTQTARLWHADGVYLAESNGFKRGIISGPMDERTCPVCQNMVGIEVDIPEARAKFRSDAEIKDVDGYVEAWKFPRIDDVDNISSEDLSAKGFLPPFHCRCRHNVAWLSK